MNNSTANTMDAMNADLFDKFAAALRNGRLAFSEATNTAIKEYKPTVVILAEQGVLLQDCNVKRDQTNADEALARWLEEQEQKQKKETVFMTRGGARKYR